MKTQKSAELFERSKRVVPGGVHSPVRAFRGVGGVPRFITSAQGVTLEDVDGNSYLDFCMAWGPMILGHRDPHVFESVQEALRRGWSYGTAEPYSLELAEKITSRLPWVEKLRFVNSGTEAVMAALRVARAATGRDKVLKFDGCYHGHMDSLLVRAGSGLADMASPDSAGVSQSVARDTLVIPLDDLEAVEKIFALHGSEIAAVIVEPIPANNGLLLQNEGFLQEIARIAKKSGALLVFDEVITGFRVGFGGMAAHTRITPDLVTYGKIIGGGFPVGAYGGRADLMDQVAPMGAVYQAGTLSANPVAMCAGIATLNQLLEKNPYALLAQKTEILARELEKIAKELNVSLRVQHSASLFWMIFGDPQQGVSMPPIVRRVDQIPATKSIYAKVFHGLLEEGVYLAPSAFEVAFLSTAHTDEHLRLFTSAFKTVLLQLKQSRAFEN